MMRTSEAIDKIAPALLAAQRAMQPARTDAVNPHLKNRYASLAAVWDACAMPLHENGILVAQATDTTDAGHVLVTRLIHSASGQWIEAVYPLRPQKDDPQGYGSALTYARRYSLSALVGVIVDDDDGNAGSRAATTPPEPRLVRRATPNTPIAQKAPVAPTTPPVSAQDADAEFDRLPSASQAPAQAAALAKADAKRTNGNGKPTEATRPTWHGPVEAQDWAMGQGCFEHRRHCENAYDKLRRTYTAEAEHPTPAEFYDRWHADVQRRIAEKHAELDKIAAEERPQF